MVPMPMLFVSVSVLSGIKLFRENRRLRRENAALRDVITMQNDFILYLAEMLDKHQVEMDEFDMIVVNDVIRKFENLKEGAE